MATTACPEGVRYDWLDEEGDGEGGCGDQTCGHEGDDAEGEQQAGRARCGLIVEWVSGREVYCIDYDGLYWVDGLYRGAGCTRAAQDTLSLL